MKKRLWVAKAVVHTSIWLGKRESNILNWNVWCSKSQRLTLNVEISKIPSTDLKNEIYCSKRSNVMICAKAKWKASKICNHSLVGGHICSFLWDRLLYLVLVAYDLIELIIEVSLWSKDYSTFDTHPQHTRLSSINAYLICVIVHVQMWCLCSIPCWSNQKRFLSIFICFLKVILYFHAFSFCSKCFLCWFTKTGSEVVSREDRALEHPAKSV